MGLTKVTTKISNFLKTQPAYEADFLVDTGAIDCMAPESKVVAAGITVEGKEVYELANGQPVEYYYGFARVAFMGAETVSKIIFGPEETEPLLGVGVLESVGIVVDPVSRTLKRLAAKPLKFAQEETAPKKAKKRI